jgi:hypothetical protein
LRAGGFAERELRVYTGQQILTDHQVYAARQGPTHRVVRAATNDQETLDLYFGTPATVDPPSGCTSSTTRPAGGRSATSPTARPCTSAITGTDRATSTWLDRPPDPAANQRGLARLPGGQSAGAPMALG